MDSLIKKKLIIYGIISGVLYPVLVKLLYPGIGTPLFAVIQIILLYYLTKNRKEIINKKALLMLIPIFILSLNYFISDSNIFNFSNLLAIFILYSTMVLLLTDKLELKKQGIKFISNIAVTMFKPLMHFNIPVKWYIEKRKPLKNNALIKKIIIGISISVPLLILVCNLMMNADLVFKNTIDNIFGALRFDIDVLFIYKLIIGILAGFYLFSLFYIVFNKIENLDKACEDKAKAQDNSESPSVKIEQDSVIINIILSSMVFVYTIFVFIQFRYLFAGASLPNNLSYAEYARHGFFELLFLSFINIALILFTVYFTREKTYDKNNKYAVITKGLMIYLCTVTVILLISSFYRMVLYNSEFGLTRLRILVIIFLMFEFIGLILTFYYIIKPKFNIIAVYSVICLIFYLTINMINIDYIIAKRNIDMFLSQGSTDYYYLSYLSADAAPQIKRLLNSENQEASQMAEDYFKRIQIKFEDSKGWQSFNLSRYLGVKGSTME